MIGTLLENHSPKPQNLMSTGQTSHISLDSFKIILEMFSEAIIQADKNPAWEPGDAQLAKAKSLIIRYYDHQHIDLTATTIEMFNDRLIGNLRNNEEGYIAHSKYQPSALMQYAEEVVNWGLVAGLVSVPGDVTIH